VSVGKIIAVLSADDMFESWHLEQFFNTLKAHPGSVIYNDIRAFMDDRRLRVYKLPEYDFDNLLHKAGFSAGVMYERSSWELAGGYPDAMRYGREDWAFGIALGQVGVCGVKSGGPPGYLYRRGDHNRTKRNKTVEWHERFKQQLRDLFPHLYRGERPVACCGNSRSRPKKKNPKRNNPAPLPGRDGMVVLEYTGRNVGAETYFTPEGNRYTFGGTPRRKTGYVDKKDVAYLLSLSEGRKRLFRRFKPKKLKLTQKQIEQVNPGTTKAPAPIKEVKPKEPEVSDRDVDATKAARELAAENELSLFDVIGTGKSGRITITDVRKAIA
jgi:pyruvate/2-oxoglutarate dehydrogenase complex dihydrolipoamide acyltransferase (E2) component